MSALEPLAVAVAVALLVALVSALCVNALSRRFQRTSSVFWAAVAALPFVTGALSLVALMTPNPFASGCHCAHHGNHHPHLCWLHPAHAEPLLPLALAVLGVWLVVQGPSLVRTSTSIVRSLRLSRDLMRISPVNLDGVLVRVADCGQPTAFTAGLLSPAIVVDRVLWQTLDVTSLRAVVHHEHAHLSRRDGLTRAGLALARACLPEPLLASLVTRWMESAELECDRHAARRVGSTTDVAHALISVERLRDALRDTRRGGANASTTDAFAPSVSSGLLEQRVRRLLDEPVREPSLASDIVALAIVSSGLFALVAIWPGGAIHHLTETLLGIFFHH